MFFLLFFSLIIPQIVFCCISIQQTNSLVNENNESFNFGVKDGVRGFFTDPSRADDSFIPFRSGISFVTCVVGLATSTENIYAGKCIHTFLESGSYSIAYFLEHSKTKDGAVTIKKNTEEITEYYWQQEQCHSSAYKDVFVYFEVDCSAGDILEIASEGYGMLMSVFKT